jgi:hypothetical protein
MVRCSAEVLEDPHPVILARYGIGRYPSAQPTGWGAGARRVFAGVRT